jgi:alginate O-acetyltransferase complex protein AlgI
MVFSSIAFLFFFLPVTLFLFYAANERLRLGILLLASLFFYFYGENYLIWVMLATTAIDFLCGLLITGGKGRLPEGGPRSRVQRFWLAVSIASNLGLLFYFKYFNFFTQNVMEILHSFDFGHLRLDGFVHVALPLGISFYTFQSMSYTIDVYRGHVAANRNLLKFSTFVTMFPQLVAGPIVRYADIEKQLLAPRATTAQFAEGVRRFLGGIAKKVLIANPMAEVADRIFALPGTEVSTGIAWAGLLCYTLQIYFDFSGYSCMAIGLGKMFGFDFPENFNFPYIARSVRDFWHRWHITLSNWFRDYVYFPLGGSRGSEFQTARNLFVVFFTCGLWHGASWNFIVWGLFHGLFLSLERTKWGGLLSLLPKFFRHAYLLLVVMVGWVFFRCETFPRAWDWLKRLFIPTSSETRLLAEFLTPDYLAVLACGVVFSMPVVPWLRGRMENLKPIPKTLAELAWMAFLFALFALCVASLTGGGYNPFIYFRF